MLCLPTSMQLTSLVKTEASLLFIHESMKSFLDDSDEFSDASPLYLEVYHELVESSQFETSVMHTEPSVIHIQDYTSVHFQTMFIVAGIYSSATEKILHLWRSPEYPLYHAHLRGKWFLSEVVLYDRVFINAEWSDACTTIIDNSTGLMVLYPHITLAATRISTARKCLRRGYLQFMFPGGMLPNSSMVYGTVAHEIVQQALDGVTGLESSESINQIISKHVESITLADMPQNQLVEDLKKSIAPIVSQIETKKTEQIEPHLDEIDGGVPPYGCRVVAEEQTMYSYTYGLNGIADVTLSDGEKVFPLEMKSGFSHQKYGSLSHVAQLSAYILMMKDKYGDMAHDFGALYYMGNNRSIKIQPSIGQTQALIGLRNALVASHVHGILPECQPNLEECACCDSLEACQFMSTHDIESTCVERHRFQFYKKIDDMLLREVRKESLHQSEIWIMSPEERIAKGRAVGNLSMTRNEYGQYEILSDAFVKGEFKLFSTILLTKSGRPPILGRGSIVRMMDYGILVEFTDMQAVGDDEDLFVDLFSQNRMLAIGRGNLMHMFAYLQGDHREKFLRLLVDGIPPSFHNHRYNLSLPSMNQSQIRAIYKGLCVKDYLVINGMRRTGKSRVLSVIISELSRQGKKTLVIGSSDANTDALCLLLIESVKFMRVSSGLPINPLIFECTNHVLLRKVENKHDFEEVVHRYNVFATSIGDARHKLLRIIDFDVVIFDDAEHLQLCDAIGPISLSKSFIVAGDTVLSSPESLIFRVAQLHPEHIAHLDLVYNMPLDVLRYLNEAVYSHSYRQCIDNSQSSLPIDLSVLEQLNPIHMSWIRPLFSSPSSLQICDMASLSCRNNHAAARIASVIASAVLAGCGCADNLSINVIGRGFDDDSIDNGVIRCLLFHHLRSFTERVGDISSVDVNLFNNSDTRELPFSHNKKRVFVNIIILGRYSSFTDIISCLSVSETQTIIVTDSSALSIPVNPVISTLIETFGLLDIPPSIECDIENQICQSFCTF